MSKKDAACFFVISIFSAIKATNWVFVNVVAAISEFSLVYGLGRFPVTLYYEQWIKLLDRVQDLRGFLEANKDKLKLKE
jgi:hypothetical protein